MEIKVCRDAALAVPAFTIASSPVNKTKGPNSILVRIQEIPEPLYPPTLEKYHAAMLVALRGKCLEVSQNKMENGNVGFTDCVSALMYALRVFSFGP